MDKEAFYIMWRKFLIEIGRSETQVAKEATETTQPTLNAKIKSGSMRYCELSDIVEKYGYNIDIRKTE